MDEENRYKACCQYNTWHERVYGYTLNLWEVVHRRRTERQAPTGLNPAAVPWAPNHNNAALQPPSMRDAFNSGLAISGEDFLALAREEQRANADFQGTQTPTASVSNSLPAMTFGEQEEEANYTSERDWNNLRLAQRDQIFDPQDNTLHFGELRFTRDETAGEASQLNKEVQAGEEKPAGQTAQRDANDEVAKEEPPESTQEIGHDDATAQDERSVSLNAIFGIAGPGHNASGVERGGHVARAGRGR